jgi:DNA-binding GntR family transcriptional regulator
MEQNSKENLRSIAQSRFLEGLLNFQLKPGQLLSQREISQIINCSMPSVREALKILESKGIVKLIPHRGVLIKEITKKEVKDAYEVRLLIELKALDLFFDEMLKEEISLLIKKTKQLMSAKKRKGHSEIDVFKERNDLDKSFHRYIVSKLNNKLMSDFHQNTESISLLARINLPPHNHAQGQALNEHLEILNSILNNDKKSAKRALIKHLNEASKRAISAINI